MKVPTRFYPILAAFLALAPQSSRAIDDTAVNLVAEGRISLSQITDTLNRKYPKASKIFWNVSGIAYHDFSGSPDADVVVGLSGYRDKGLVYNDDKQLVEDAGAAFAYFRLEKDDWKLKQVEVVEGKKYEGFEGANLTGAQRDQLVVYSSDGDKQMASIFAIRDNGTFERIATITGYGLGPRVARDGDKALVVDFQHALVNHCDDCGIYYGRPYDWDGKKFVERSDEFLDHVQSYDPFHTTGAETAGDLAFFEGYLSDHPNDFCALANCYDLSNRLDLNDKAEDYRRKLARLGSDSLECKYCDEWLTGKNQASQKLYLEQILNPKNQ